MARRKQDPEEDAVLQEQETPASGDPGFPSMPEEDVAEIRELMKKAEGMEEGIGQAHDDMIRAAYRLDLDAYQEARKRRDMIRDEQDMYYDRMRFLARKAMLKTEAELAADGIMIKLDPDGDVDLDHIIEELENGRLD